MLLIRQMKNEVQGEETGISQYLQPAPENIPWFEVLIFLVLLHCPISFSPTGSKAQECCGPADLEVPGSVCFVDRPLGKIKWNFCDA